MRPHHKIVKMKKFQASFWSWAGEEFIKIILLDTKQGYCFIFNIATQDIQSVHDRNFLFDKKIMDLVLKCVRHFVNNYKMIHDVWTDEITLIV